MRGLVLDFIIPLALIWGLTSAERSILVLNWIWFQRPYAFSWGFWSQMPVFKIAVAFMIFSNTTRGELKFKFPKLLVIYLMLLTWLTISAFASFDPPIAWATYREFIPSMWFSPVLMYAAINNLALLKKVIWVAAGGLGLIAVKTGIVMTAKGGGHITAQINGFVGDNNVFGLTLCVVFAVLMGLRTTLPKNAWAKRLFYFCIVFILLCIIYTESRGAMLTLFIIWFTKALSGRQRIRNITILIAVSSVLYLAVPYRFFHRLSTLDDIQANASAMGRIQNWELAWREALRFPVLGVGPGNHIPYNLSIPHDVQVRVAHSIYFQLLGEEGFPGLTLYLLFVVTTISMLISTWKFASFVADDYPELKWTRELVSWMTCGYIGFLFGSAFLNVLYIEFPWYVPFYASMLRPLMLKEIKSYSANSARIDAANNCSANGTVVLN